MADRGHVRGGARRAWTAPTRPIRKFRVGAAVLRRQRQALAGCNVENAAYPQGTCAEAAAIAAMVADGERRIVEVAGDGRRRRAVHALRRLPPAHPRVRRRRTRRSISAGRKACAAPSRWASCCRMLRPRQSATMTTAAENARSHPRARAGVHAARRHRARLRARRHRGRRRGAVADPLMATCRASRRPASRAMPAAWSLGRIGGTPVALLPGRAHYYEHGRADAMQVPVRTLARARLRHADPHQLRRQPATRDGAGHRDADHRPHQLHRPSPLFGETGNDRFVDMVDAYDAALRQRCARRRAGGVA